MPISVTYVTRVLQKQLNTRFLQNASGIAFDRVLESIIEVLQIQFNTCFSVNNRIRVLQSIIESHLKIHVLQSIIESLFAVNNNRLLITRNKNRFRNRVTRRVLPSIMFFTVAFCSKWNRVSHSRFAGN
jgi:hypothetical protein